MGNGIQASHCCQGALMFGQAGNTDQDDGVRIVHRAPESRREDVVPANKANGSMGEDPNLSGSSQPWIITEADHSPRWPGTDHLDLRQVRHLDPRADAEETLSVEQLTQPAENTGLSLTHLAMVSTATHPVITSAIIGSRTTWRTS